MLMGPLSLNSQSLGLILTTNLSDSTYGWHAARTGLVLYFYHWEEKRNEHQEISLTSSMVQTAELFLTKTKLLGKVKTTGFTAGFTTASINESTNESTTGFTIGFTTGFTTEFTYELNF